MPARNPAISIENPMPLEIAAKIKSHASEILETTQKEIGAMLKT